MTADLKAARARVEVRITHALASAKAERAEAVEIANGKEDAVQYFPEARDLAASAAVREKHAGDLRTLLTALDQAAEALKPFADEGGRWLPLWRDDHAPICAPWGSIDEDGLDEAEDRASFCVGDLRRAATVYATLKPEGEGT